MELDVSFGAVGAALIGAAISLIGLIIAKEAKISEFRQKWIDDLRTSLAAYLTHINSLWDFRKGRRSAGETDANNERDLLNKLNSSYYDIALRINDKEDHAKELKSNMIHLAKTLTADDTEEHDFDQLRVKFISCSARLLKSEWTRVRDGERVYRLTRSFAWFLTFLLILAFAFCVARAATESSEPRPGSTASLNIRPNGNAPELIKPHLSPEIRSIENAKK